MQSQDDRDAEGFAARRDRAVVAAVKEYDGEEVTGRYEGEELEMQRALRPEVERIGRLEKKHDELKADVKEKHDELKRDVKEKHDELKKEVGEVRTDLKTVSGQVSGMRAEVSGAVGKLDGQEKVLTEMLGLVKKTAEQTIERDHISFTTKVEVEKAHDLAKVEVDKEQQLAVIEVVKEEKVDIVKARRDRRRRNLKILGLIASGLAGGGVIVELLHKLWGG
jgi:hypothetical protein